MAYYKHAPAGPATLMRAAAEAAAGAVDDESSLSSCTATSLLLDY